MKQLALFAVLVLASCSYAKVVDYNGNSLRIVSDSAKVTPQIWTEAQRICHDKGLNAEFASSQTNLATFETLHLFLCMNTPKANGGLPGPYKTVGYLETTASM